MSHRREQALARAPKEIIKNISLDSCRVIHHILNGHAQVALAGAKSLGARQKKAAQGTRAGGCRSTIAQTGDYRPREQRCKGGGEQRDHAQMALKTPIYTWGTPIAPGT